MRILRRLEQTFGRFAVPHATIAIIAVQVMSYGLIVTQGNPKQELEVLERLLLIPSLVLQGEVWRLFTFLAVPPVAGKSLLGPIWALLAWYVFYLLGTTLEQHWGTFRYNLYLLVGYVATVAVAFLAPQSAATNSLYLQSVFLAFAFLFPEFQFLLFFILPVKVKWLALLVWLWYGVMFLFGGWMTRLMVLAAIANFLLFFWRDILDRLSTGRRRMSRQVAQIASAKEPAFRHRCTVCGITEKTHPQEDFRYCSKCEGQQAYCSQHLRNHEHVTQSQEAK
ncbi:MAG: rhomboid family intramembrane serine protease [Planctomycetaceae bacterium]